MHLHLLGIHVRRVVSLVQEIHARGIRHNMGITLILILHQLTVAVVLAVKSLHVALAYLVLTWLSMLSHGMVKAHQSALYQHVLILIHVLVYLLGMLELLLLLLLLLILAIHLILLCH